MKVLVTGASGFIGRHLVSTLLAHPDHDPVAALRRADPTLPSDAVCRVHADFDDNPDFAPVLEDIDTIIHCAARVHTMHDTASDPLGAYCRTNETATIRLATAAAACGVRRFIYLSTIKVHGESTEGRPPFTETDPPDPQDPYAVSKHRAEQGLLQIAAQGALEIVIVRPPLVYGRGVKANFRRLLDLIRRPIPLPLGAITSARSLVAIENLTDFIITCITHPAAAGQTFLVSDGDDLSTPELIRRLARALGQRPWLVPVPPTLLSFAAAMTGQRHTLSRLRDSLQLSTDRARELLGWQPPVTVDQALQRLADQEP